MFERQDLDYKEEQEARTYCGKVRRTFTKKKEEVVSLPCLFKDDNFSDWMFYPE